MPDDAPVPLRLPPAPGRVQGTAALDLAAPRPMLALALAGSGRTVVFVGSDRGVGTTFLTVMAAVRLSPLGRVLLVDAAFDAAAEAAPGALSLDAFAAAATLARLLRPGRAIVEDISGVHLLPLAETVRVDADTSPDAVGRVIARVRSSYDVVLVDVGTGASPLVAPVLSGADKRLRVSAIAGARRVDPAALTVLNRAPLALRSVGAADIVVPDAPRAAQRLWEAEGLPDPDDELAPMMAVLDELAYAVAT